MLWTQAAAGQMSAPPIPSVLPGVSKISPANAAGVLKYCAQSQLASGASIDQVLEGFQTKPDVKSADYSAGAAGQVLGDGGKRFSIPSAPSYLQSQACNIVLERAKSFQVQR